MDTRTICLAVLSGGEATGYEIKKCVEESFGYFLEISHSSIYPALAELHRERLVSCTEVRQEGRPDKKVYRLTELGWRAFREGLARSPGRHRVRSEFVLLLMFAQYLAPARVTELIDQREREFGEMRAMIRSCPESELAVSAGLRFVSGLGEAMFTAGLGYLRENRDWLEAGLAQERPGKTGEGSA